MKKKQPEPTYRITLKGLLSILLPEQEADRIWDAIELQAYRNKTNAVVLEDGGIFTEVEKREDSN